MTKSSPCTVHLKFLLAWRKLHGVPKEQTNPRDSSSLRIVFSQLEAASRVPYRLLRSLPTLSSPGLRTSQGSSTCNSRVASDTKCALFTSMNMMFHGSVRGRTVPSTPKNRSTIASVSSNLKLLRGGIAAKKSATKAPLLPFFISLPTYRERYRGLVESPLLMSTHLPFSTGLSRGLSTSCHTPILRMKSTSSFLALTTRSGSSSLPEISS